MRKPLSLRIFEEKNKKYDLGFKSTHISYDFVNNYNSNDNYNATVFQITNFYFQLNYFV